MANRMGNPATMYWSLFGLTPYWNRLSSAGRRSQVRRPGQRRHLRPATGGKNVTFCAPAPPAAKTLSGLPQQVNGASHLQEPGGREASCRLAVPCVPPQKMISLSG
jgi:hypothetical protein